MFNNYLTHLQAYYATLSPGRQRLTQFGMGLAVSLFALSCAVCTLYLLGLAYSGFEAQLGSAQASRAAHSLSVAQSPFLQMVWLGGESTYHFFMEAGGVIFVLIAFVCLYIARLGSWLLKMRQTPPSKPTAQ